MQFCRLTWLFTSGEKLCCGCFGFVLKIHFPHQKTWTILEHSETSASDSKLEHRGESITPQGNEHDGLRPFSYHETVGD